MDAIRRLLRSLPFLTPVLGCSSPGTNVPPAADNSCKNVITYEISDEMHLQATHHYDDMGHIISYIETNHDVKEVFQLSRTYDDHGNRVGQVVDTIRFDPGHREMTWEYDDTNRVIRSTYKGWGSKNTFRDTRVTYDAAGRRDTMNTDEDGVPTDRLQYVYIEGEPSIVEEQHTSGPDLATFYGFRYFLGQGRWLKRLEFFNTEIVQSAEWYTYADMGKGMVSRRDFDSNADGTVEEIDSFSWNAAGLMVHADYDSEANGTIDQTNDYAYDAMGRITQRNWHIYDQGNLEFVTNFVWTEDGLEHVERADASTGQVIEAWSFSYGCSSQWLMNVPISPIQGFRYEMQTLPVGVDASSYWTSFESL